MIGALKRVVWLSALLVVAGILFAIVDSTPSTHEVTAIAPSTGFGGYHVDGTVRQMSAAWTVPAISTGSPPGAASTWIGVQSPSISSFIQVGTTENELDGLATYHGFWSDAAVSYHPQLFMSVQAGDVVRASIARDGHRWVVTLADRTEGTTRVLPISSATVRANRAEWVQEDPTAAAVTSSDLPYPVMAGPVFSELRVNRRPPALPFRDGQVLSTETGVFFVPTRERDDGFAFTSPHGAARQYLVDARQFDAQYFAFVVDLTRWSGLSDAARANALVQVEGAYSLSRSTILRQRWPVTARHAIGVMADALGVTIHALRRSPPDDQGVSLPFERAAASFHLAVDGVRARLGLPPAA